MYKHTQIIHIYVQTDVIDIFQLEPYYFLNEVKVTSMFIAFYMFIKFRNALSTYLIHNYKNSSRKKKQHYLQHSLCKVLVHTYAYKNTQRMF